VSGFFPQQWELFLPPQVRQSTRATNFTAEFFEEIENEADLADRRDFSVRSFHYHDAFAVWVHIKIPARSPGSELTG